MQRERWAFCIIYLLLVCSMERNLKIILQIWHYAVCLRYYVEGATAMGSLSSTQSPPTGLGRVRYRCICFASMVDHMSRSHKVIAIGPCRKDTVEP